MLESQALMSTSIAFPELSIPVVTALKRFVKKGKNGKVGGMFKVLIERMEGNAKWVGEKRKGVEFAPGDRAQVEGFLEGVEVESSPLGTYWRLQKKVREAKRREVEKVSFFCSDGLARGWVSGSLVRARTGLRKLLGRGLSRAKDE